MMWYDYLSIVFTVLLTLWMIKFTYFFMKRKSTQTSVVDLQQSKEDVFYEPPSEILDSKGEKKSNASYQLDKGNESSEVLCRNVISEDLSSSEHIDIINELKFFETDNHLDNQINCVFNVDITSMRKKAMDTKNVQECSDYDSTEDEIQKKKDYSTTFQDVLDTCKLNCDSNSTINLWESCNKEISLSESDNVNCLFSENPEICQPLNLCKKDQKKETETINKPTRTYFTDRRHKSSKDKLKIRYGTYLYTGMYENKESVLKLWNAMKNEFDSLQNIKIRSSSYENLKNLDGFKNKEHSLNNEELEFNLVNTKHELKDGNNLEISKLSSHDELEHKYSVCYTAMRLLEVENNLVTTKLSSHDESEDKYSLNNTEHELKVENNLVITKLSSYDESEDGYSLNNTEEENHLEITELSSIHHDELTDEYILLNTEHELKEENSLEITELSSIHHDELRDEYILRNTEFSLNNDELMLENDLETTRLSPINQDELDYDFNLKSPELSSLNNYKSISGIDSPKIKCTHEVQGITEEFMNISSSECTESFPSPIFNNDSSIDDIRYVEDYYDISFFDTKISDDAMNEAFVEDVQ